LSAGSFVSGAGSLSYAITGTPASGGTASFALNIGGQTCTLDVYYAAHGCCAKVSATEYKDFLCHNLGAANASADPFTPTWEINRWLLAMGRIMRRRQKARRLLIRRDGAVSGWNTTDAANGSWADGFKTVNDPCPAGYRVPTDSAVGWCGGQ
jgi:hypothetical protein